MSALGWRSLAAIVKFHPLPPPSIVILLPIIPLTAGEQVDDGDGEGAAALLPPLGGDGAVDDAQPPKASHLLPPAPPSLP